MFLVKWIKIGKVFTTVFIPTWSSLYCDPLDLLNYLLNCSQVIPIPYCYTSDYNHHHHHPSLCISYCWVQASSQNERADYSNTTLFQIILKLHFTNSKLWQSKKNNHCFGKLLILSYITCLLITYYNLLLHLSSNSNLIYNILLLLLLFVIN